MIILQYTNISIKSSSNSSLSPFSPLCQKLPTSNTMPTCGTSKNIQLNLASLHTISYQISTHMCTCRHHWSKRFINTRLRSTHLWRPVKQYFAAFRIFIYNYNECQICFMQVPWMRDVAVYCHQIWCKSQIIIIVIIIIINITFIVHLLHSTSNNTGAAQNWPNTRVHACCDTVWKND